MFPPSSLLDPCLFLFDYIYSPICVVSSPRSFITSRYFPPSPLFSLRLSLSPSLSPFLRVSRLLLLFSTHLGTKNVTDNSYPLPPSCEDTEILRVVVRESLSGDLARKLLADIIQV
jgi:hypothetical protein